MEKILKSYLEKDGIYKLETKFISVEDVDKLLARQKHDFYTKLMVKLLKISEMKMTLSQYLEEVAFKIAYVTENSNDGEAWVKVEKCPNCGSTNDRYLFSCARICKDCGNIFRAEELKK